MSVMPPDDPFAVPETLDEFIRQNTPCRAVPGCPYKVGNTRTKRCDLHQREFELAAQRWRWMDYNHRHGKGRKPPDKNAYIDAQYSQPDTLLTYLNADQRHTLRLLLQRASASWTDLERAVAHYKRGGTTIGQLVQAIWMHGSIYSKIIDALTSLATEPEPPPPPKRPRSNDPETSAPAASTSTPAPARRAVPVELRDWE